MAEPSAPRRNRIARSAAAVAGRSLLAAALVGLAAGAAAEGGTPVERGDTLRIEVIGVPEFAREARVDTDGAVALPYLGAVSVAGSDTGEIREKVAGLLSSRGLLNAPEVLVEVSEYRPVYVGGVVANPGEIPFRPGLTVRQALIAAGGLERRSAAGDSGATAREQIALRRAVALEYAQGAARIRRLEEELLRTERHLPAPPEGAPAGDAGPSDGGVPAELRGMRDHLADTAPLSGVLHDDVLRLVNASEDALMADRQREAAAREEHVDALLGLVSAEIGMLERQAALQQNETEITQAEVDDARSLVERGLMPLPRLQELLKNQSELWRDRLDTEAFAARARQNSVTLAFEENLALLQRRQEIRIALQEAIRRQIVLRTDLDIIEARLAEYGLDAARDDATPIHRIVIHRKRGGTPATIAGHPEDELRPGDVIEIVADPGLSAADASAGAGPQAASWDPARLR